MSSAAARRRASHWSLRLVEFNLHIARFAHRSWYEHALPPHLLESALIDEQGRISARAEPQISQWLLCRLGLQDTFDWDMREPQKRLWLLDSAALERLAQLLSLAMHREWLLQIIDGSRLRSLRDAVGPESYHIVIDRVPPDSFHHHAPVVSFDSDAGSLSDALRADGARTLFHLLEPSWRAVRERAVLNFVRGMMEGEVPTFTAARHNEALELIRGHLIPGRLPEWVWLF